MDQEINQVIQAILIAADPSQGTLHQQALQFLSDVQQNANNTWRLALTIFVEGAPEGGRKYPPQARFFALRVLDDFLDNRIEPLDEDSFRTLQQALLSFIQSEYVFGNAEASATFLRNKFSHTLTLFFLATYTEQWPTFFVDLFALIRPSEPSSSQTSFNHHVSLLFFHIVLEISGEVADQIIKSARAFTTERHVRDARVRDAMRDRDAAGINEAVLTIVAESTDRMSKLQKGEVAPTSEREESEVVEVVDCGVRTFASYVGWIDINLTVTPTTVPLLFSLLSDRSLAIRLATSTALLRIVSKGLKEPADKLQLIKVLSLTQVLDALEKKTRAEQESRKADGADEGEESYREALGRLLNALGLELIKLVDECPDEMVRLEAGRILQDTLFVMIRFMSDEYDDTCSTIFPMLQMILASYKKARKMSTDTIDNEKRAFLASLLETIMAKMIWDEDTDFDDLDEDDREAFEGLRKDLRSFMESIYLIDSDLVTEAIRLRAMTALTAYTNGVPVKWFDAEIAVYLTFLFGEINKSGGKGRAAFCQTPAIAREDRKKIDYSSYPLTSHGELLLALIQSGISAYPHRMVVMQFFETVVRYADFFKVRKDCVVPTLESMVDARGLHSSDQSVQTRVFYLFHRFIKENRGDISVELSGTLLGGIRDLLEIQVEVPELESPETDDVLSEATKHTGIFDAQLYLFETVGILLSAFMKSPEGASSLLQSIATPLLDDLSVNLQAIKGPQDVVPVLKVHHTIMALGNIAKGFPDYPTNPTEENTPPLDVFRTVAQAILVSLEAMNVFKVVRDATRFAFARILATTGPTVTQLIPTLMANLLAHFEPSELVDFINFIGLLIHKLQEELFDVMDQLLGPLSQHITGIMSQEASGTDDKLAQGEIKRAYLTLINNLLSSKLAGIFISDRNMAGFESLLNTMIQLANDFNDAHSQKAAFTFMSRSVTVWGTPDASNGTSNGNVPATITRQIPGFGEYIYKTFVPTAFTILSSPSLNIKDPQILMVLHEIANFLQTVITTRGPEGYEFFVNHFLPTQSFPPDVAIEFTTKMRDLDNKSFRKYLVEFVRASRSS